MFRNQESQDGIGLVVYACNDAGTEISRRSRRKDVKYALAECLRGVFPT